MVNSYLYVKQSIGSHTSTLKKCIGEKNGFLKDDKSQTISEQC